MPKSKHVFVPPTSPAYNKMGGVDRLSQSIKYYSFDRKFGFTYFLNSSIMLFTMLTSCRSTTVGILSKVVKKIRLDLPMKGTRRQVAKWPFSSDSNERVCKKIGVGVNTVHKQSET